MTEADSTALRTRKKDDRKAEPSANNIGVNQLGWVLCIIFAVLYGVEMKKNAANKEKVPISHSSTDTPAASVTSTAIELKRLQNEFRNLQSRIQVYKSQYSRNLFVEDTRPTMLELTEQDFSEHHQHYKQMSIRGHTYEDPDTVNVIWKNQTNFYYLEVMPTKGKDCSGNRENIFGNVSLHDVTNPSNNTSCHLYDFQIIIYNNLTSGATVHWHGLTPPSNEDGVPFVANPNIIPKNMQSYRFNQYDYPGSYWMHSHTSFQESYGIAAPLILQHDDSYFEENGFSKDDDLVVMLESKWKSPVCAFASGSWYLKECKNIPDFDLSYTINRQEEVLEVIPNKGATSIRIRFINGGSWASWYVTNRFSAENNGTTAKMEFLATDGHDVKRNITHPISSNEFFLGVANRIDVLVQLSANKDIVITGEQDNQLLRHILIRAPNASQPIIANRLPAFGKKTVKPTAVFGALKKLTAAHPIPADVPISKKYTIISRGGDFDGGFPLTIFKGLKMKMPGANEPTLHGEIISTYTELNNLNYQLPPYKKFYNNKSKTTIRSTRGCNECTNNSTKQLYPFNAVFKRPSHGSNYTIEYGPAKYNGTDSCCWEWCDVENKNCSDFELKDVNFLEPNKNYVPLCYGDRVRVLFMNSGTFIPNQGHPMHLHGHEFVLRELYDINDEGELILAKTFSAEGPKLDTVFVPWKMAVVFDFDANNPGDHLFHCHVDVHLRSGMLTTFRYDYEDEQCLHRLPDFVGSENSYPNEFCDLTGRCYKRKNCKDYDALVLFNGEYRRCKYFKRDGGEGCSNETIASHCPLTCNACGEYCSKHRCKDSQAEFLIKKKTGRAGICSSIKEYQCKNKRINSTCPEKCGGASG